MPDDKSRASARAPQTPSPDTRRIGSRQASWLAGLLRLLACFSPRAAAWLVERRWRRVQHFAAPPREAHWVAAAQRRWIGGGGSAAAGSADAARGALHCWVWEGRGPSVLLVHGWAGRGAQLGAFAAPLLAAGYRVIAVDLPGHGDAVRRHTDVAECADALLAVDLAEGPLAAVVGHSFGVAAAALACRSGLRAARFVGIAPPAFGEQMLAAFEAQMSLSPAVQKALRRRLARRLGADFIARLSTAESARHCRMPALIVHDEGDRAVGWQAGRAVADAWDGGAEFHLCRGLGHFRVLRDAAVIERCVSFIEGARSDRCG